eukprot:5019904-Lingulodinium_polyedra.AAC.1
MGSPKSRPSEACLMVTPMAAAMPQSACAMAGCEASTVDLSESLSLLALDRCRKAFMAGDACCSTWCRPTPEQ